MKLNNTMWIGVSDAARAVRVSEPTIRYAADRGRLRCTRDSVGRRLFKLPDLVAFRRAMKRQRRMSREKAPVAQRESA